MDARHNHFVFAIKMAMGAAALFIAALPVVIH